MGTDLGNQFVYVVDAQHKVEYRKVDTGPLFHGLRVIDNGLNAGDVVVINGLQRVRPGAEVTPQQVAMNSRLDPQDKALVDAAATDLRRIGITRGTIGVAPAAVVTSRLPG